MQAAVDRVIVGLGLRGGDNRLGVLNERNDEEHLELVLEASSVRGKVRPGLRVLEEPAERKTENPKRKQTKGPRPEPDHLPEELAFVTCPRERQRFGVRGLTPPFSRWSQGLGVSDLVASGALRATAGA